MSIRKGNIKIRVKTPEGKRPTVPLYSAEMDAFAISVPSLTARRAKYTSTASQAHNWGSLHYCLDGRGLACQ